MTYLGPAADFMPNRGGAPPTNTSFADRDLDNWVAQFEAMARALKRYPGPQGSAALPSTPTAPPSPVSCLRASGALPGQRRPSSASGVLRTGGSSPVAALRRRQTPAAAANPRRPRTLEPLDPISLATAAVAADIAERKTSKGGIAKESVVSGTAEVAATAGKSDAEAGAAKSGPAAPPAGEGEAGKGSPKGEAVKEATAEAGKGSPKGEAAKEATAVRSVVAAAPAGGAGGVADEVPSSPAPSPSPSPSPRAPASTGETSAAKKVIVRRAKVGEAKAEAGLEKADRRKTRAVTIAVPPSSAVAFKGLGSASSSPNAAACLSTGASGGQSLSTDASAARCAGGAIRRCTVGEADGAADEAASEALLNYWRSIRVLTRTPGLEALIARRAKGAWLLGDGEGLDWEQIRNRRYSCTVPPAQPPGEADADDCIDALLAAAGSPGAFAAGAGAAAAFGRRLSSRPKSGLRLLDLGCGVGAFLARLREDDDVAISEGRAPRIDWTVSCGVTSLHMQDIYTFEPPAGHPEFFREHVLRFDLDSLAERAPSFFGGTRFDLITSHFCICHLKDPLGALCTAYELLAPGGMLFFIEPINMQNASLPYTDRGLYAMGGDASAPGKAVPMNELLLHWAVQGVKVFSSGRRLAPHHHVLALRKPASGAASKASLGLPPRFHAGPARPPMLGGPVSTADWEPFAIPEGCSTFKAWLAASA